MASQEITFRYSQVSEGLAVVVNPRAASGRAPLIWDWVCQRRPQLKAARVISEDDPQRAAEALTAVLSEIDRVIVVGGDGTVHGVVNQLLDAGVGERVAFGVIPAGTGSDLARTLALPRRSEIAADAILDTPIRSIDALRIDTAQGSRWVINIASVGLSGLVATKVNAIVKRRRSSYVTSTLSSLLTFRPPRCRVFVDDTELYEGPIFLMAIANGSAFGKGMVIAPMAQVDDGMLDVVIIEPIPLPMFPFLMPKVFRGSHIGHRLIRHARGRRCRLELLDDLMPPFETDGEGLDADDAVCQVHPNALRLLGGSGDLEP